MFFSYVPGEKPAAPPLAIGGPPLLTAADVGIPLMAGWWAVPRIGEDNSADIMPPPPPVTELADAGGEAKGGGGGVVMAAAAGGVGAGLGAAGGGGGASRTLTSSMSCLRTDSMLE